MSRSPCCPGLRWLPVMLAGLGLACAANSFAAPQFETQKALYEIYRQAVASPIRTDDDRSADAKRKPLEFLQFAEVRPGMRVLDITAGGGYTTQLLALVAGGQGTVWAQGSEPARAMEERLASHPQSNIVPVDREKLNRRLFDALKRGGHLIVLDHSAKPGSGITVAKTLHRIDEKVVLDEELKVGFQLEKEGYFMKNPADPRDQAFFDMTIPTDKFALRFVKP